MPERTRYVLDVDWDKPGLPSLVGPFETDAEARGWARLNVPNGAWSVRPMRWPYAQPVSTETASRSAD